MKQSTCLVFHVIVAVTSLYIPLAASFQTINNIIYSPNFYKGTQPVSNVKIPKLLSWIPQYSDSALLSLPTSSTTTTTESFRDDDGDDNNNDTDTDNDMVAIGRRELSNKFNFPLDDWQLQAGGEIFQGNNVIVCAPTGSGKTVVGEMALHIAHDRNKSGIYTTPLKALSNQKFSELRQTFGPNTVGLSTGDMSINRDIASIVVMTTEVYRNIAWRWSQPDENQIIMSQLDNDNEQQTTRRHELDKTAVVVLDEFHYMGLPGRGGVWEESVITSPPHTQIVGLSATLPNAAELAEWMQGVTGRKTVLVVAPGTRPVPLRYMFATRDGLFPLFRDFDAGPGAPLGLLGFRGEDVPNGKAGRINIDSLPKGLEPSPTLQSAARRRIQRVEQRLQKQIAERKFQNKYNDNIGFTNFDGTYEPPPPPRRGRGRGRDRNNKFSYPMTSREERKERERLLRSEMRKSVPSLPVLLNRLNDKNMLPAIFFIFSRIGCERAAESVCNYMKGPVKDHNLFFESGNDDDDDNDGNKNFEPDILDKMESLLIEDTQGRNFRRGSNNVNDSILDSALQADQQKNNNNEAERSTRLKLDTPLAEENWFFYSKAGLLSFDEVKNVASRVAQFNNENPDIQFDNKAVEQILLGVGSHHAGMLPAHKGFVESIYRSNLMKAVFATETLAAGINMPARTTVVCSLSKRTDESSMKLLETSNLLQMSGRAGRRGMDSDGTCVIVATPFESHEEAAKILTSPVKPITSQFTPSYALAVNLITRGKGKLDVAKQLVSKSFAVWERKQQLKQKKSLQNDNNNEYDNDDDDRIAGNVLQIIRLTNEDKFMTLLAECLEGHVNDTNSPIYSQQLGELVNILKDRELLKKASKSYSGVYRIFGLEKKTLQYLESELNNTSFDLEGSSGSSSNNSDSNNDFDDDDDDDGIDLNSLFQEDQSHIKEQIEKQRQSLQETKNDLMNHPFSKLATITTNLFQQQQQQGNNNNNSNNIDENVYELRLLLGKIKNQDEMANELFAYDLVRFAKSVVVLKRRARKLGVDDPQAFASKQEQVVIQNGEENVDELIDNSSWNNMLAITKVLVAYGCLETISGYDIDESTENRAMEQEVFDITAAGKDVGMLGFENSLWCYVAMGGTYDICGVSSALDEFRMAMGVFDNDEDYFYNDNDFENDNDIIIDESSSSSSSLPVASLPVDLPKSSKEEAERLISLLLKTSPSELAGYVSCLVNENSRSSSFAYGGSSGSSMIELFQMITPCQQRLVQCSLMIMERFIEVQKQYNVDDKTRACTVDITNCEVVTAWAAGCSWNEALQISGAAPGDLARILSRAMDALRQFGNVQYRPFRKNNDNNNNNDNIVDPIQGGFHPQIRQLCREAVKALNRYPVKDQLPFEAQEDEVFKDEEEEENDEEKGEEENNNKDNDVDAESNEEEKEEEEDANGASER